MDRGAELNVRDTFIMGPEKELKALVNVPMEASCKRFKKAVLTFFTKNTESKVRERFNSFKISGLQVQARLKKVRRAQELYYPKVEKDLLAQIKEEQKAELFSKII
jgi:RecA-family ATPase